MSVPTRHRLRGIRAVLGSALTVAVAGVAALAVLAPWPSVERQPAEIVLTPASAVASATCTGALISTGRNTLDASELGTAADATAVGEGALESLATPIGGTAAVFTGDRGVAGAQSARVAADDLTGFAANACAAPTFDSWLVGGATTTGAADLLIIGNPADVPATVDLTLYGTEGVSAPAGGRGLVVGAHAQIVVPLAGLIIGESNPVVRVESQGAPVATAMQSSRTQTLDPVGVDVFAGGLSPAPVQVMPGVTVPAAVAEGSAAIDVRMLAPAAPEGVTVTTTVTVTPVGAADPTVTERVELTGDVPIALSIPGLPAGDYSVRVESDLWVVAAAQTASAAPRDFAWYPASPVLVGSTLIAVPPGPAPRLVVEAERLADAVITLTPLTGGDAVTRNLAAGASDTVALPGPGVWRIDASDPVRAALTFSGDGALAGIPVQPSAAQSSPIRVLP